MKQREDGFYWVRLRSSLPRLGLECVSMCLYDEFSQKHVWFIPGSTAQYTDNYFEKIQPKKLEANGTQTQIEFDLV